MIRQPGKRGPANRSQSLSGKAHHGHDLAWLNRGGSKVVRHTNPRGCPDEIYDSGIPAMSPRHGWTGLVSAGLRALHDSRISPIASSLSIARRGRRRPRTFSARGGEFSSRADHTAAVGGRCRRCRQSARPCRSSKRGPLVVASPLDQSPGDEALGDYMSYEAADEFVEGIPLVRLGRRSRSTGLAGCVEPGQEVVQAYRERGRQPGRARPDLTRSLHNLSIRPATAGCHQEAERVAPRSALTWCADARTMAVTTASF